MPWNRVDVVAPPTDRVIEVTSGGAWTYVDRYAEASPRHGAESTWRHWQFRGGVALVIWIADAEATGGIWLDTRTETQFRDFAFWREYENPLADMPGLLTSTVPPHPIEETFEGDARLRLYDAMEAKAQAAVDSIQALIGKDADASHAPTALALRYRQSHLESLERIRDNRTRAYDPYELPDGVQGTAK